MNLTSNKAPEMQSNAVLQAMNLKSRPDALSLSAGQQLFSEGRHAVPVNLQPASNASIMWINRRAMADHPVFLALGRDVDAWCRHLLDACAWIISDDDHAQNSTVAYADRYGGSGIGINGGSGRAVVINGYHAKGIGRTPLVGALTDEAHASGGAYLEECVRETIFSELIAAEFPHSAIPNLAIIDTGLVQVWNLDDGSTKRERRMLLVRPCMLRPAHFERASTYISDNPKEGAIDFKRVQHMFDVSSRIFGKEKLKQLNSEFFMNWAEQLAYSFVHRLSVAGHSTSNIGLDGKLLDFGACASLPSWAHITMIPGCPETGDEFSVIVSNAQSLAYFFGRFLDEEMGTPVYVNSVLQRAWQVYLCKLSLEVLRLCGIRRLLAEQSVHGPLQTSIFNAIRRILSHYRKESFDILEFTPAPTLPWDIADVWQEIPPFHLSALKGVLEQLVCDQEKHEAAMRCLFISRTRANLFREELKYRLYPLLEQPQLDTGADREQIASLINREVAAARRDCRHDPDKSMLAGFAVADDCSLAIFFCFDSRCYFALAEWMSYSLRQSMQAVMVDVGVSALDAVLPIHSWSDQQLVLGNQFTFTLNCAVQLRPVSPEKTHS